jgi:hypothetical protein
MAHYIDFGHWQIEINCNYQPVLEGLQTNFGSRFTSDFHPDKTPLTCSISYDEEAYKRLLEDIKFTGPRVEVSQTVVLDYALDGDMTWLQLTDTAIIAFNTKNPSQSQVWLAPCATSPESDTPSEIPCPEAFVYPLLAEWMRNFDACLVHCGAVVINGKAVILSGPSGSGKSTQVLRMLMAGADFLADDLAILINNDGQTLFYPLREVANVHVGSIETFPELEFIKNAPLRGDGKFLVSIPEYFHKNASGSYPCQVVLRLYPDKKPWLKPCEKDHYLDHLHRMAWFSSRPDGNITHFWLLTDWLMNCEQWCVSQGYLAHHLDELLNRLRCL